MSRTTHAVLSAALMTVAAASANAWITGTTGQVNQVGAPPNATLGAIVGTPASAWDEQQNFVTTGLPVDLSINPSNSGAPTPGVVSGLLDSHLIHWNDFSGASCGGTVSFSSVIVGVAYSDNFLDVSDPVAGAFGTLYPTFMPNRGINSFGPPGSFVSINLNTITFNLNVTPGIADFDQIRVYTQPIPTPGSVALLAAGGLVAGRRRRA